MLTTPSASGSSWHASRIWSAHLIIPINAALGALYLALRHGAFPGPVEVPILDLIALEDPIGHKALRVWYFAVPTCVTFSLGYLVVSFAAPLRRVVGRAAALPWTTAWA